MRRVAGVLCLLLSGLARAEAPSSKPLPPMPSDEACPALPPIAAPHLPAGEALDYDIDVLAANAARMEVETLPRQNGLAPVRVRVKTNTFFNKVRRVRAEARSYLDPKTLRPRRYMEESWEDELHKLADVAFHPLGKPAQTVSIKFATNPGPKTAMTEVLAHTAHDALDEVGAAYYIRSLDLKPGLPLCFDVYAMRHLFRVWGTVGPVETVSTPAGEFRAFHITGTAARLDKPDFRRELHVWISADARRIPIGALGGIDLGPVRAMLTHIGTPGGEEPQSHAAGLDW